MKADDCGVSRISGSFSEDDGPLGLVPCVRIDRLRLLMMRFSSSVVVAGTGRAVAFRLDTDLGLSLRFSLGVTMIDVYDAARAVGLITVVDGREVPFAAFVALAKTLTFERCTTCGVGDRATANERCWVCDAREEQRAIIVAMIYDRSAWKRS